MIETSQARVALPLCRRELMAGCGAVAAVAAVSIAAPALAEPVLYASQAPSIAAAFDWWQRTGGVLVIDRDFIVESPITMAAERGRSYRLTTAGARTLRYQGGRFHWALCLYSAGATPLIIDGDLTIDGNDRVSIPLFVRFENVAGTQRRNCTISGLTCRNARMVAGRSPIDGTPTNAYGASGMLLAGGFDHLLLRDVVVENVTRAAGAGRAGSQGCVGIAVTANLTGTQSARHVTIEDFRVSHIDSEDLPSSPARGDMDGVLVFQSAELDGTRPIIQRGSIRNAAGRAVKVYAPGGGGLTQGLTIYRAVPGPGGGGAIEIAHQHGDGVIADIDITYAGAAHLNPTTVIGMSSGTARSPAFPFGVGEVRNLRIHDTTGAVKRTLFGLQYNVVGDQTPRRYVISDVTDDGQTRYLILPGALGTSAPVEIDLTRVNAKPVQALLASEDAARMLNVVMRQVTLGGSRRVPAKVLYNDRPVPPGLRLRVDTDATVKGLDLSL